MGQVDKKYRMMNLYLIIRRPGNWQISYFSTFCNLQFSSVIILAFCGSKLRRILFKVTLVKELLQEMGRLPQNQTTTRERQAPPISQLNTLDPRHNKHWLLEGKRTRCRACSAINNVIRTKFKCPECNMWLCVTPHFEVHQNQTAFLRTDWHYTGKVEHRHKWGRGGHFCIWGTFEHFKI